MPKHFRKLLVAAALCWVPPASAGYHDRHESECAATQAMPAAAPGGAMTHAPLFQSDRVALLP